MLGLSIFLLSTIPPIHSPYPAMHLPLTFFKKKDPSALPVHTPHTLNDSPSPHPIANMFTTTTASSSIAPSPPPSHTRILPTRTASTRIQLPTALHRSPTNPSQTQPSTQKSPKYTSLRSETTTSKPANTAAKPSPTRKSKASRPDLQPRRTTAQTRYIDMLLSLDTVPRIHNIFASFSTWILLAGYIVFPATFTGLKDVEVNTEDGNVKEAIKKHALDTVR